MESSPRPQPTPRLENVQGPLLTAKPAKGEVIPFDLRQAYCNYFEVLLADDEQLLAEAHRLRYQVYCVENDFEDPAENHDGLETDQYDERSVHCLLRHKPSGAMAGTVRIVLPDPSDLDHSFALQEFCEDPVIRDPKRFPVWRMGEISRFCISKVFRQRSGDGRYPRTEEDPGRSDERRVIPNMILGLIEGLVRMSVVHNIDHWCGILDPALLRLLARLGGHGHNIGPIVNYHGRRQPCYLHLVPLLEGIRAERPDVWDIITDGGRHWDALHCKNRDKGR